MPRDKFRPASVPCQEELVSINDQPVSVESVVTADCVEEERKERKKQAMGQNNVNSADVPESDEIILDWLRPLNSVMSRDLQD